MEESEFKPRQPGSSPSLRARLGGMHSQTTVLEVCTSELIAGTLSIGTAQCSVSNNGREVKPAFRRGNRSWPGREELDSADFVKSLGADSDRMGASPK